MGAGESALPLALHWTPEWLLIPQCAAQGHVGNLEGRGWSWTFKGGQDSTQYDQEKEDQHLGQGTMGEMIGSCLV